MGLLDIGDLDRRVAIRTYATTENDFGEPIDTWSTLATVWARVDYGVTARGFDDEDIEQGKETSFSGVEVCIRYRDDLTEKMKLRIDSEDYDIKNIAKMDDRGRNRYLIIKAVRDE